MTVEWLDCYDRETKTRSNKDWLQLDRFVSFLSHRLYARLMYDRYRPLIDFMHGISRVPDNANYTVNRIIFELPFEPTL
jgi:hypothetical protein